MFKKLISFFYFSAFAIVLNAIDASLAFATFKSPEKNYIEIYLFIAGSTVTFTPAEDTTLYSAAVDVTILFKQEEDIVKFDKFQLNCPPSKNRVNFVDLKRYGLSNGDYELIIKVQDIHQPENVKEYNTPVSINYDASAIQQSDIQLLASVKKDSTGNRFVKNGIFMEPLPFNFYGRNASTLFFYQEVYNTDLFSGTDLLISYFIEKLGNGMGEMVMIGHKRKRPQSIIPLLLQMDISRLASGNYNLVVEVRNSKKELISKKMLFFQRSNPFFQLEPLDLAKVDIEKEFVQLLTEKELEYALRALTPKLPQQDIELVNTYLKEENLEAQRMYLFSFWIAKNPNNPELAYSAFMEVVEAIDKQFRSGFRFGFETDRGFIYLKYGQPNDIQHVEDEPSAPPYEIWSYNTFPSTRQNNVKFLFYNPSLAPGDFVLLHSNALGELNNPQWLRELYRDAPNEIEGNYFDGTGVMDNNNRNASRYFNDF